MTLDVVGTDGGRYSFNGDFDRLHAFARALAHHLHRQRLEAVAPEWDEFQELPADYKTES